MGLTIVTRCIDLETKNYLEDLTDKLESFGVDSYMKSFISDGPKFYAYLVHKPDGSTVEVCKLKGVTLNYANSNYINYKTIRSLITGERKEPIVISFDAIRRTSFNQVVTRCETKTAQIQNKKRRIEDNFSTLPFGY